jgi:hypothetical protein
MAAVVLPEPPFTWAKVMIANRIAPYGPKKQVSRKP